MIATCFTPFENSIASYTLPEKFTFPFSYEPHPLSVLAAQELKKQLDLKKITNQDESGKMFGVLIVKDNIGNIGYLSSFSGYSTIKNNSIQFVPPIFDDSSPDNLINQGLRKISTINLDLEKIEKSTEYISLRKQTESYQKLAAADLNHQKEKIAIDKKRRKTLREEKKNSLSPPEFKKFNDQLVQESLGQKFYLKHLTLHWEEKINKSIEQQATHNNRIDDLKKERKTLSAFLQQKLFEQYAFLNQYGESKNLLEIFKDHPNQRPPAGAGECAAPKLLQYAFLNQLQPISMAEFWWGNAPKSEIRKHEHYYPSCQGKCKPILGHMLAGIEMDENPLLINHAAENEINIEFEDDELLIINKPANLISVPGNHIQDSVFQRMKKKYPLATGPLIVHRLDMSTSGIMLIAKTKLAHQFLQSQFIKRTIKKRYIALLDGDIKSEKGTITLPLRGDLNDRPRQLVCFNHGKNAITKWEVIDRSNNQTRVYFYPITGRTHQLRIHSAHHLGLNTPILGDDLYGTKSNRLHLHAERIEFIHPKTNKKIKIEVPADF